MKNSVCEAPTWWERTRAPWTGHLFERMNLNSSDEGELRIQKLREEILAHPDKKLGKISIHRARLITESYMSTEGEPPVIRRGKAIYHVLKNIPIWFSPHQLIIGSPTAEPHGAEIEPEFFTSWLERKVKIEGTTMTELQAFPIRNAGAALLTKEDRRILEDEILPYWTGKDLEANVIRELKRIDPEKYFSCRYSDVCMPIMCHGMAHTVQDYATVLKKGLKGMKAKIEEDKRQLNLSSLRAVLDFDRIFHYDAMILCADAVIVYANRCADMAQELAKKERNERRREVEDV